MNECNRDLNADAIVKSTPILGLYFAQILRMRLAKQYQWIKRSYCLIVFALSSNCSSNFLHVASAVFFSATAYPWLLKFNSENNRY